MSAGLRIGTVCISLLPPLLLLQLQILGMSLPFAGWSWVLTSSVCGRKAVSMCSVSATGLLATFLPTPIPQPQLSLVLALRTALMGQLTPLSCTVFRAHPDICPQPPHTRCSTNTWQCRCALFPVAPGPSLPTQEAGPARMSPGLWLLGQTVGGTMRPGGGAVALNTAPVLGLPLLSEFHCTSAWRETFVLPLSVNQGSHH